MFPGEFDYRRADSVREAQELLAAESDRDARLLAGGHGLVPSMKLGETSPGVLVDVSGVDELSGIEADDEGVAVGATTTHAELVDADELDAVPVLPATAGHVADRQIRNRATLGGNLAEADPAADFPAAAVAAGAEIRIREPDGQRTVAADDFFAGDGETALGQRDVLTAVRVPRHDGGAYAKKTHPATGYAMVGVAAAVDVEDGAVADAGVAAVGVQDRATRLTAVEDAAEGAADEGALAGAAERAEAALDGDRLVGDVHAAGEFRAELLPAYVERALADALADAR